MRTVLTIIIMTIAKGWECAPRERETDFPNVRLLFLLLCIYSVRAQSIKDHLLVSTTLWPKRMVYLLLVDNVGVVVLPSKTIQIAFICTFTFCALLRIHSYVRCVFFFAFASSLLLVRVPLVGREGGRARFSRWSYVLFFPVFITLFTNIFIASSSVVQTEAEKL